MPRTSPAAEANGVPESDASVRVHRLGDHPVQPAGTHGAFLALGVGDLRLEQQLEDPAVEPGQLVAGLADAEAALHHELAYAVPAHRLDGMGRTLRTDVHGGAGAAQQPHAQCALADAQRHDHRVLAAYGRLHVLQPRRIALDDAQGAGEALQGGRPARQRGDFMAFGQQGTQGGEAGNRQWRR